jgi:hypothetical protein
MNPTLIEPAEVVVPDEPPLPPLVWLLWLPPLLEQAAAAATRAKTTTAVRNACLIRAFIRSSLGLLTTFGAW